jgi:hypothetical protein
MDRATFSFSNLSHHLHRRRMAIGLVALLGAGTLTGFALASSPGSIVSNELTTPSVRWHWNGDVVPGAPFAATANVQTAAIQAGVVASSVREAVKATDGLSLLFGQTASGALCSADTSPEFVSDFSCLSGWTDNFALLYYETDGGPRLGVTDHASLVGVARSDVSRVSITTTNGTSNLALNQWRGFSYVASSASNLPLSITAYASDGTPIETKTIESAPDS